MTDIFKAATEGDHKAMKDWLSPHLEPSAGTMGAPVWGGPDSAPWPMAQTFNHAGGSVGSKVVANGIVVKGSDANVIIDGLSDVFKIAATAACTWPAATGWSKVTTTITLSLGLATTPAPFGFVYVGALYAAMPCPIVIFDQYGPVLYKREIGTDQSGSTTHVYLIHLDVR
jgi:hypothetical protein